MSEVIYNKKEIKYIKRFIKFDNILRNNFFSNILKFSVNDIEKRGLLKYHASVEVWNSHFFEMVDFNFNGTEVDFKRKFIKIINESETIEVSF